MSPELSQVEIKPELNVEKGVREDHQMNEERTRGTPGGIYYIELAKGKMCDLLERREVCTRSCLKAKWIQTV